MNNSPAWYVWFRGQEKPYGPVDAQEISRLLAQGQIDQDTLVHGPSCNDWTPVGQVPLFFSHQSQNPYHAQAQRKQSNVPMIMGIIGGILGLPAAMCSGACAVLATGEHEAGDVFLTMGVLGAALGLLFGVLGKVIPIISGVMMLIAAVLCGITIIAGNVFAIIPATLLLIGGFFCFGNRRK